MALKGLLFRKVKEAQEKAKEANRLEKEYKRKCNECGKTWHSSVSKEKNAQVNIKSNAFVSLGMVFGGNMSAATQSRRNYESQQEILDNLRKCPNCGSKNYTETLISFEKK